MKRKPKIILVVVLSIVFFLIWFFITKNTGKLIVNKSIFRNTPSNSYFTTGSFYKDNFIYGGAMQLAFNELNENILHEKLELQLKPEETGIKKLLDLFNQGIFSKNDLDEKSYYIKSGYGQATVDKINKESRAKFPSKGFADLDVNLDPKDIIAYAYFLKQIEYKNQFEENKMKFLGQNIKSFRAESSNQKNGVLIVNYQNDDNFVVKLDLKDNNDEIYLAKGYQINDPNEVINEIRKTNKTETMGENDIFEAPYVHLDYHREYPEFMGKYLANKSFISDKFKIDAMYENIKFDMDNKGARVENEGAISIVGTALRDQPKIKKLVLDKPYWIIMKRADSKNPYFVLGINNTEWLVK